MNDDGYVYDYDGYDDDDDDDDVDDMKTCIENHIFIGAYRVH